MNRKNLHLIRIDALGQNNFRLQRVGGVTSTTFTVAPGDDISFVAYRNQRRIDYEIFFKDPRRTPFTDVDRIEMPHGGVSQALAVTTLQQGGMEFGIRIPSLGWQVDPEILVDGSSFDGGLRALLERMEQHVEAEENKASLLLTANRISVTVTYANFVFDPATDPIPVHARDTISWKVTQTDSSAPDFRIHFSAQSGPQSPLVDIENDIPPDYYDGAAAFVSSRLFRPLLPGEGISKDFTYVIAMTTGDAPASPARTIRLS